MSGGLSKERIMQRLCGLGLATIVLFGCQSTSANRTPAVAVSLSPSQIEIVKAAITPRMKDPDSVRFGEMMGARNDKGEITVCGYVNAKNSFGGYVGMSPFYGVLNEQNKTYDFGGTGTSGTDRMAVVSLCKERGVTVD